MTLTVKALCFALAMTVTCWACGDVPPTASGGGGVAVAVLPLNLDRVTDAAYTIRVTNAPDGGGEVVWVRSSLRSTQYGDGAGSLSYVGPCDADTGASSVTLTLDALYGVGGTLIPATNYDNPGSLVRNVACVEGTDASVTFDITLARAAQQGFFDVVVAFSDVFCSAKLDCVRDGTSDDLELLHNPNDGGARDLTAVLGFACTGDTAANATTYLYMDDPVITCSGLAQDVTFDIDGVGGVDLSQASNPSGYLFAAAVYRDSEELQSTAYWDVGFGLESSVFTNINTGDCQLTARATASATPFASVPGGFAIPDGKVYPVIAWSVPLTTVAAGRACTTHQVGGGDGVAITYPAAPAPFQLQYSSATGLVSDAAPTCSDGVMNGDEAGVDCGGSCDPCLTALLLHGDGADGATAFPDSSASAHASTPFGDAQVDTTRRRLGSGAIQLDGADDYVAIPYDTAQFDWWTADHTIDMWVYNVSNGPPSPPMPLQVGHMQTDSDGNYWSFGTNPSGKAEFYYYSFSPNAQHRVTGTTTIPLNTWTHLAMVQSGGTITVYVNGVAEASGAISGTNLLDASVDLVVGKYYNTSFHGDIDELRVSHGVARWTANFTPPTAPYAAD